MSETEARDNARKVVALAGHEVLSSLGRILLERIDLVEVLHEHVLEVRTLTAPLLLTQIVGWQLVVAAGALDESEWVAHDRSSVVLGSLW